MNKITVLHSVLYGCETWSFILREDHRSRALEQSAAKNISTCQGGKTRGRRELHDEELHNIFCSY